MTSFERAQWSWPKDLNDQGSSPRRPGSPESEPKQITGTTPNRARQPSADGDSHKKKKHYKPRTCRICLEVVQPTTEIEESTTGLFSPKVRVRYISEDPDSGRLISPCKCRGTQKYVHEGCLQAWRRASPLSDRNYWSCPTCKFSYRMSRLTWGRWLGSWTTRAALTVLVMVVGLFLLGFAADPLIGLWIDPVGSITDAITDVFTDIEGLGPANARNEPFSVTSHFSKGLLSLGVVGFVKTLLTSPVYWIRWGLGGFGTRRRRGRERIDDISLYYVAIGLFTFMAVSACVSSLNFLSDLTTFTGDLGHRQQMV
ncbi:hypothetical protein DL546_006701 [Coniochaeta pulveracea]|uniref:RING-CH-type domain-containing protein n=1 Tax=Coniochaeta pulveracea TaxID=177199 RepID=A0A420Y9Z7_9PEZI|nr:hypothetical protein DL546_006701 [Coniochaeta pulveracea]